MIVIVTPRPTRPGHRGRTSVELYVAALAAQLSQRHPLTLVSPKRGPVEGAAARRLLKRCLALDPAIVQVENRPRWVLALRRFGYRGRIILHLHSQTFLDPRRLGPAAARRAVRAADVIVCNSDDLRRRLLRRFGRRTLGHERLVRIHPGIDTERFRARRSNNGHKSTNKGVKPQGEVPVILFAGRIVPQKGLDVLLKACRKLARRRPFRLLIAGGPRPRPGRGYPGRLVQLARPLGPRVRWLGPVAHERMPALYQRADLLACPSQGAEAFGLVNAEALAAGVPVVASRVGGIPEIVRHGRDGYLVRAYRRPSAWARQLARALADADLRRRVASHGPQRIRQRFSLQAAANAFDRLYRQLLDGQSPR